MTDSERAELLLSVLSAAIIIHTQGNDSENLSEVPGLVGAPPREGEEDGEKNDRLSKNSPVHILNKITDMLGKTMEVSARYEMAKAMNLLKEEQEPEDMIEQQAYGVTFSMKLKNDIEKDYMRAMELAANLIHPYMHYALFIDNPTAEEFMNNVEWEKDIDDDEEMDPKERELVRAFMAMYVPMVCRVLNDNRDAIKERSRHIFVKTLDIMHNMADDLLKQSPRMIVEALFVSRRLDDNDVIRFSTL